MENDTGDCFPMEGNLNRPPLAAWPRKGFENSYLGNHNLSRTPNTSSTSMSKTPSKYRQSLPKTVSNKKTKTPIVGDRFIPNRSAMQFDISHYKITNEYNKSDDSNQFDSKQAEFKRAIGICLKGYDIENTKIISYKPKAPAAPEGFQSELRVLYNQGRCSSTKKPNRHIPANPERILDAPEIMDDYYLNLIDWSSTNVLAVGLNDNVYLWNASNGQIDLLLQIDSSEKYVASVSWIEDGSFLAVGTSTGEVELWDVKLKKRIRVMTGHTARVGALSWNQYVLSSGSRSGSIHHHDVRVASHFIGSIAGHTQEVCGLRWSPNGRYLASGGNDNAIHIWPTMPNECFSDTKPIYSLNQHTSAVKALAWCPWQSSILATGGGTSDRCIKLWSSNTGECLSSTDTKSQVCALLWSKEYKEIISGHGYAHNQLAIWKYPGMQKVTELVGHSSRILHMAMSPDGQTVVSAAADETLRLWKCFTVDATKVKNEKRMCDKTDVFLKTIR